MKNIFESLQKLQFKPVISRIIVSFCIFSNVHDVIGQSEETPQMNNLLSRYWFYRYRLRNDFMVMGSDPGQSLVVDCRNPEGQAVIKYGDDMILHGYYLTMLAIEHRMLEEAGRYEDLKNKMLIGYFATINTKYIIHKHLLIG